MRKYEVSNLDGDLIEDAVVLRPRDRFALAALRGYRGAVALALGKAQRAAALTNPPREVKRLARRVEALADLLAWIEGAVEEFRRVDPRLLHDPD